MRKFVLAAATAAIAVVTFAAPSSAGGLYFGFGDGGHHNRHGYVKIYDDYDYRPSCWIKKIRKVDYYGNVYVKKVRICD